MSAAWEKYTDEVDREELDQTSDTDIEDLVEIKAKHMWRDEADIIELMEDLDCVDRVETDTQHNHTIWVVTEWEIERAGEIGIRSGSIDDSFEWLELRSRVKRYSDYKITNTRQYQGQLTVTVSPQ